MRSELNTDLEEMSPWPKLVCRTSTLGAISSAIAMYVAILSDASPSVVWSCITASAATLVPMLISGGVYSRQKLDKGLLSCKNTEKGEFYRRVFVTSTGIAISSVVVGIALLPDYSLDAFFSAMIFSLLAIGVANVSNELRDADNIKSLRREVDSLDENREREVDSLGENREREGSSLDESRGREGSYFANKLRNFDLIGYFKKNREDSLRLNLLQEFAKYEDEEYKNYSERERILFRNSPNSGSRYGSVTNTTTKFC